MTDLLIRDIHELITCRSRSGYRRGESELNDLEVLRNAAVAVENGRIVEIGTNDEVTAKYSDARTTVSAAGKLVSPGLVDCHSHLLYGGSRHEEYETLVSGKREPGKNLGGGIRYSVSRSRSATNEQLQDQALRDLDVMLEYGTTTLEVKTGYGLDRENELRFLRLQAALQHDVELVRTFLGAHVLPDEYQDDRQGYVQLVIDLLNEAKDFAEFCDVTCDPSAFDYDESLAIAEAAARLGFKLKIHADQTGWSQGTELAVRMGATSVDHLDYVSDDAIAMLAESDCVGVLLPTVSFHMLEMTPTPEHGRWVGPKKPFLTELARRLVKSNVVLALSCDYNPGTSPTRSMQMTMQMASRLFRLSYAEIWHMSTINAAKAVGREDVLGSVEVGKKADLVIWGVPEHGMVINRFGTNLVETVVKDGRIVVKNGRRLGGPPRSGADIV